VTLWWPTTNLFRWCNPSSREENLIAVCADGSLEFMVGDDHYSGPMSAVDAVALARSILANQPERIRPTVDKDKRIVVTVTLTVTLGTDSSARLAPALDYVLTELDRVVGPTTANFSETKIVAASARFEGTEPKQ
jgi:hypothetical protein